MRVGGRGGGGLERPEGAAPEVVRVGVEDEDEVDLDCKVYENRGGRVERKWEERVGKEGAERESMAGRDHEDRLKVGE